MAATPTTDDVETAITARIAAARTEVMAGFPNAATGKERAWTLILAWPGFERGNRRWLKDTAHHWYPPAVEAVRQALETTGRWESTRGMSMAEHVADAPREQWERFELFAAWVKKVEAEGLRPAADLAAASPGTRAWFGDWLGWPVGEETATGDGP